MFLSLRLGVMLGSACAAVASSVVPAYSASTLSWADSTHDFIDVSVGGGKPVPVTFDTGSVGLVIFQSAVGKGAVKTKDAPATKPFPGRTYNMTYENAKITVAGITTVSPVKIGVVNSITCTKPGCSPKSASQLAHLPPGAAYGILGIGFGTSDLENPFLKLPSPYNAGFVVSNGAIQLGSGSANGFSKPLQLSKVKAAAGSGGNAYNKYFQACFTIAGTAMKNTCVPTMFDTGVPDINIPPSFASTLPAGPVSSQVKIPNVLDLHFEGGTKSATFPFNQPVTTHANLGLPLLLDYDVALDFTNGTYRFRKHAASGVKRKTGSML